MRGYRKKISGKKTNIRVKSRGTPCGPPENTEKIIARTGDLLDALCTAEGIELVHVEFQREPGGRILRLYIDGPGGVTLDDCVNISRQASDMLDVYIENLGSYRLEVSSPGPNRPLGKMADFEKFKGNRVKLKTDQPIDGRKKISGILMGITEGMINLSINDRTVVIPYHNIVTARLVNSVEK